MNQGLPKLWLIQKTLAYRAAHPEVFGPKADYVPLRARGSKAEHVVAFARAGQVVTVAPRLVKLHRPPPEISILRPG